MEIVPSPVDLPQDMKTSFFSDLAVGNMWAMRLHAAGGHFRKFPELAASTGQGYEEYRATFDENMATQLEGVHTEDESKAALDEMWAARLERFAAEKTDKVKNEAQKAALEQGEDRVEIENHPTRWGDGKVIEHCLVEAAASLALSDILGLPDKDRKDFFDAALVHDAHKAEEINAINDAKARLAATGDATPEQFDAANDEAYDDSKRFLEAHGVRPEVVKLTGTVAHTSIGQFVKLNPTDNSLELKPDLPSVELAMHWIDDATAGTKVGEVGPRMDDLIRRQDVYPYNEAGRKKWGRTYFEAQREAALLVQAELERRAGLEAGSLPAIVNTKLAQMIIAHSQKA